MTGIERIAAERRRQIDVEGWTPEHDAGHAGGELAMAAAAYLVHGVPNDPENPKGRASGKRFFPKTWHPTWWKPAKADPHGMTDDDRIRHLEKAGALAAAEIDRILNQKEKKE